MKVLITSGGTREHIDDVRVMTNISSGKLGARLADRFILNGHFVEYVYTKGSAIPSEVQYADVDVEDCYHGYEVTDVASVMSATHAIVPHVDAIIHPMAVSDFTFEYKGAVKCGSDSAEDFIEHMRRTIKTTPKVISHFREWNPKAYIVGFKFTSGQTKENLIQIALNLIDRNGLNAVFANDRKQMMDANEHVGYLVTPYDYNECKGKDEIVKAIHDCVNGRW